MGLIFQIAIVVFLISLAVGVSIVLLNYQRSEPDLTVLNITYFGGVDGDMSEFKGLTLPFSEETRYTAGEVAALNFVYIDFKVPENTVITAAMPGKVTNVVSSERFDAIYIYLKHPTTNLYVIYAMSNSTMNTVLVKVGDSANRGDNIAVVRTPIVIDGASGDSMFRLGVAKVLSYTPEPVPVPLYLKNNEVSDYWTGGEPKYFR